MLVFDPVAEQAGSRLFTLPATNSAMLTTLPDAEQRHKLKYGRRKDQKFNRMVNDGKYNDLDRMTGTDAF